MTPQEKNLINVNMLMSSKKKQKTLFSYLNSKDIKSWKVKPKRKKILLLVRDINQDIIKNINHDTTRKLTEKFRL